ncbi:MAG: hypothetical protein H6981_09120 [Gammaproteobacteria bacterium]|nr:hypothetical protein [Gammaproteobacteria bacterium]MCP5136950.1 hypothetical protein [Gammaproteobacteria bacterium]
MKRVSPALISWFVLLFCAMSFAIVPFNQARHDARIEFGNSDKAEWAAVNAWLQASECMRKTGAWLTVCDGDRLRPVSDFALADDPGFGLLIGIKAYLRDKPMSNVDVVTTQIWTNFLAVLALAALLNAAGARLASLLFLLLGDKVYVQWLDVSPHPIMIAAATFVAILPLTILLRERGHLSKGAHVTFLILGTFLMGFGAMLREPIGTMGFLITAAITLFLFYRSKFKRPRVLLYIALAWIGWHAASGTLAARDAFFPVEAASGIETHGVSHNLYLGLGAVPNKFDISWLDTVAADAVHAVDPDVQYVSPEYYRILWAVYWQRVKEDPLEVIRIYWTKFWMMLDDEFPDGALRLRTSLLIMIAFLVFYRYLPRWVRSDFGQIYPVMLVSVVFIGFFLLQGMIAHPAHMYAHPVTAFILLVFVMLIEIYLRSMCALYGSSSALNRRETPDA